MSVKDNIFRVIEFKNSWLLAVCIFIILVWSGCSARTPYLWKKTLPKEIAVGRMIQSETPWLAIPGGNCGGAFFNLKTSTKRAIKNQGEAFFVNATISRSGERHYTWSSPTDGKESSVRMVLPMDCISGTSRKLAGNFRHSSGNYFASESGGKMQIGIFLDKDLVFVGFWD